MGPKRINITELRPMKVCFALRVTLSWLSGISLLQVYFSLTCVL